MYSIIGTVAGPGVFYQHDLNRQIGHHVGNPQSDKFEIPTGDYSSRL